MKPAALAAAWPPLGSKHRPRRSSERPWRRSSTESELCGPDSGQTLRDRPFFCPPWPTLKRTSRASPPECLRGVRRGRSWPRLAPGHRQIKDAQIAVPTPKGPNANTTLAHRPVHLASSTAAPYHRCLRGHFMPKLPDHPCVAGSWPARLSSAPTMYDNITQTPTHTHYNLGRRPCSLRCHHMPIRTH